MIKVEHMTDSELKTRIMSLNKSIQRMKQVEGTEDQVDELQAELDLLQEERETRHLKGED